MDLSTQLSTAPEELVKALRQVVVQGGQNAADLGSGALQGLGNLPSDIERFSFPEEVSGHSPVIPRFGDMVPQGQWQNPETQGMRTMGNVAGQTMGPGMLSEALRASPAVLSKLGEVAPMASGTPAAQLGAIKPQFPRFVGPEETPLAPRSLDQGAASPEDINRGDWMKQNSLEYGLINPDGSYHPVTGTGAVDRQPNQYQMRVMRDAGTGEVLQIEEAGALVGNKEGHLARYRSWLKHNDPTEE